MEMQASRGEEAGAVEMGGRRRRSSGDLEMEGEGRKRSRWAKKIPPTMMIICLMLLVAEFDYNSSLDRLLTDGIKARIGWKDGSSPSSFPGAAGDVDKLLGGLLSGEFDEASCLSRYQVASYWKNPSRPPPPHLVAKLRRYEALHRRCGPGSELFKEAIRHLNSSSANLTAGDPTSSTDCSYVVWVPSDGLGNRIIALVSTFLYALLNDKVLLLRLSDDLRGLLCEPFPGTSWALPEDFPVGDLEILYKNPPWTLTNAANAPYLYLHLTHDRRFSARGFFCDDSQLLLQSFRWLVLRSNQYFVPALFRSSVYEKELKLMFPEATVFYHLGRYLLRPTNSVWGHITRYYDAYLATAEEIVGLQIRVFPSVSISSDQILAQILNCSWREGLLPEVITEAAMNSSRRRGSKPRAVLLTTLNSGFYERLRSVYDERATADGKVIAIHQPSHEEAQHSAERSHNKKALMEMYLLSFCDELVTSGHSTFGYVAQGLGGLQPWILMRSGGGGDNVGCQRAVSTEPCFHSPAGYSCVGERKSKQRDEEAEDEMRLVGKCEDIAEGLKLVS